MTANLANAIKAHIKSKGILFIIAYNGEEKENYVHYDKSSIQLNSMFASDKNIQAVRNALNDLNVVFKEDHTVC